MNRLDELLNILLHGGGVENWKSLNRLEQYLICILTRNGIEQLGKPLNRLEVLLQALYYVVPDNAIEILSAKLVDLDTNMPTLEIQVESNDSDLEVISAELIKQESE
jgi:hypothetical protein